MQRIGIYPGTFDPIHIGHVSFARTAIDICGLDQVIFLPEAVPRGKVNVSPLDQRIAQIETTISDDPTLGVRMLKSTQFTVAETLPEIQSSFTDAKLTLLVGSDVMLSLRLWNNIDELLQVCDIAIGMRSNHSHQEVQEEIDNLKQQFNTSALLTIVHTDHPSATSSVLREVSEEDLA